jgi:hypothetical protein
METVRFFMLFYLVWFGLVCWVKSVWGEGMRGCAWIEMRQKSLNNNNKNDV